MLSSVSYNVNSVNDSYNVKHILNKIRWKPEQVAVLPKR